MQIGRIQSTLRSSVRVLSRQYATAGKLVIVSKNESTGVSTLSLNRPPVNGFNLELLTDLKESLEIAQKDGSKGVILTSSLPTIFSGGLDIMEMYKPDMDRARKFWTTLQDTWLTLYGLSLPIAAAVNGASPAGGCLLAISCEYRVFVDGKHQMGLNETKLGIVAPTWFKDPYVATIGQRRAELALLRGEQFTPQQALQIGLVDELATNKEDALAKAEKYVTYFTNISGPARARTKEIIRGEVSGRLKNSREQDTKAFLGTISQPQVQAGLEMYIQSLKKKN